MKEKGEKKEKEKETKEEKVKEMKKEEKEKQLLIEAHVLNAIELNPKADSDFVD